MSQEEKDEAEAWIGEHVLFQDYLDGGLPTIEGIGEVSSFHDQKLSKDLCD